MIPLRPIARLFVRFITIFTGVTIIWLACVAQVDGADVTFLQRLSVVLWGATVVVAGGQV